VGCNDCLILIHACSTHATIHIPSCFLHLKALFFVTSQTLHDARGNDDMLETFYYYCSGLQLFVFDPCTKHAYYSHIYTVHIIDKNI
jgi:hypothetical protein